MVAQVAVDVLEAVMPVEDQVALPQGPEPGDAELHHVLEMSDQLEYTKNNLPLPRRHMAWVDVCTFKMSKN